MKIKLTLFIAAVIFYLPSIAQLDANKEKELTELKNKSRVNKSTFLIYDTIFYKGDAYSLMKTRRVSDQGGDEYVIKNLKGQEIIYIIEPDKIDRTIGNISGDNYYRFTLLTIGQKMNIPSKSIGDIPEFVAVNNLIVNNNINIDAVNKLRLIYDEVNPQQYSTTEVESTPSVQNEEEAEAATDTSSEDMSQYLPVVRNRRGKVKAKNYVIRQDDKVIGFYEKRTAISGGEKVTVFDFFLSNKVKVATATNDGVASVKYKIEIMPTGKTHITSTGVFNPAQDLAEYLIKYNVL